MEQRLLYAKELYKNETLLKAALWLVVYSPGKIFKNHCSDTNPTNTFLTDYHGKDIIENPELYDTEVKPEILKLFELNNNYSKYLDKDDLTGSLRKFLFENKTFNQKDKWYILERSYRAYKSYQNISDGDSQCEYDFRECRKTKTSFDRLSLTD